MNTFEFVETARGRELRARFTDSTFEAASNAIGSFLAGRAFAPLMGHRSRRLADANQTVLPFDDQSDGATIDHGPEAAALANPALPSPAANQARMRDVLYRDPEGRPRLDDTDLKASTQRDYSERLTCLLLYANHLEGKHTTPRPELADILRSTSRDGSLYDPNFQKWLIHNDEIAVEGDALRLNRQGRQRAQKILAEMEDPSVVGKWKLGVKASGRSRRKPDTEDRNDGASSSRNTPRVQKVPSGVVKWVASWNALAYRPSDAIHELFSTKKALDKGLLALWAVKKVADDKDVTSKYLAFFLFEAFQLKVHARSLESAFQAKPAKALVAHVQGTKFQALPPGMKQIEELVNSLGEPRPARESAAAPRGGRKVFG